MRRRPEHGVDNSPMQMIIKNMPDVANVVFDKCIYLKDISNPDVEVHNYEFLDDIFILPEDAAKKHGSDR